MPKPNIIDLRGQLPTNGTFPQRPLSLITLLALHYQGADVDPSVPILDLLRQDAQYHIDKDWGGGAHGYGIEYHYAADEDGLYQVEDETAITWNDTNANVKTLALVCPKVGPNTPPGDKTLGHVTEWLDWMTTGRPDVPVTREDVFGHGELIAYGNATACPGPTLLEFARAYRANVNVTPPDTMVSMSKAALDAAVTYYSVIGDETYKASPNMTQIQIYVQEGKHQLGA